MRPIAFGIANISSPCIPNMKEICTLKNSPKPHIHAKATEFPHNKAFSQRKFILRPSPLFMTSASSTWAEDTRPRDTKGDTRPFGLFSCVLCLQV